MYAAIDLESPTRGVCAMPPPSPAELEPSGPFQTRMASVPDRKSGKVKAAGAFKAGEDGCGGSFP